MEPNLSISSTVIILLLAESLFALALPLTAMIIWKIKFKVTFRPTLMGIAAFFVFAMVGQQVLHSLVLDLNQTVSDFITSRPLLNGLYTGLAAGLFEETARLLMFKKALGDDHARENAVAYGIGHGGIECIIALGLPVFVNFFLAITLNTGGLAEVLALMSEEDALSMSETISMINDVNIFDALLVCLERLCTFVLQITLSVMVFSALHLKKMWLYAAAIAAHTGIALIPVLYDCGFVPLWLVELLILLYVAALFVPVLRLYRTLPSKTAEVDRFGRPIQAKR